MVGADRPVTRTLGSTAFLKEAEKLPPIFTESLPKLRLFVAVNLPDDVRSTLWSATETLRARDWPIRWVDRDLLHVTVKFLGNVEPGRVAAIERALAATAQGTRSHAVSIEGMGAFPTLRRPKIVWVGCEPVPAMELLHHGVERSLLELGFPTEGRTFRPHITVGRVKRAAPARRLVGLEVDLETIQLRTTMPVSSVELMESRLGPSGPRYRIVRSFDFGA